MDPSRSAWSIWLPLLGLVVAAALSLAACGGSNLGAKSPAIVVGGSAEVGQGLIARYGCGSCHMIPGVKGADGLVGPPLLKFGRRSYIGGHLANTPDNLIRWLMNPQAVEPGTDMPNLGISEQEARNMAAYLERLG